MPKEMDKQVIYTEPVITSAIGIDSNFNLTTDDLESRGKSFLDEKTLRLAGIRRVSDDVGHQLLNITTREIDKKYPGLGIPYFNVLNGGAIMEFELRRDFPGTKKNSKGEERPDRKYLKPPGSKNLLYIPPMVKPEDVTGKKKTLVIFEGAFKALVGARCATNNFTSDKWAFIPVSISGVDNFKTKRTKIDDLHGKTEESGGLVEFDLIDWKGKSVVACFDSDLDEKSGVKAALNRLKWFFRAKGAKVHIAEFPKEYKGIKTKGFDDYIGAVAIKDGEDAAIREGLDIITDALKPKPKKSATAENFTLIDYGESDNPGVYFDDGSEAFKVCSPLRIAAETQTETGEKYGRFLEWYDSKKRLHKWAMPVELLHTEGGRLAGYLHSQGLEVMPSPKVRDKLNLYIATAETSRTIISTDKTGWHGDCYVLPDKSIGYAENEIAFQSATGNAHKFKIKGTLQEWQENVSRYCRGNSRLLLAVSCAFGAPLLPIVNEQGGGFHFLGDSSLGKSTGLLVAGSVIGGGGKQGAMETWKATINGLEAIAALHNHNLLILDEISEADPRYIGNAVYMLSNGMGKLRMRETLQARQSFTWQLLFMSSGEKTLERIMADVGQNVKTGQEVRLAEIPADSGKFGLFEKLHGFPHGSAFSDYMQAQSIKFYGSAFYEYLKFLADFDFQSIRDSWYSFRDSFIEQVFSEMQRRGLPGKDKTPSEVLRVAKRFALCAFGGELATKANITLWDEADALDAAKKLFVEYVINRDGFGGSEAERAMQKVKAYFEAYGQSRFQNVAFPETRVDPRAGYYKQEDGGKTYYCLPQMFKTDVCKGFDYRFVIKILKQRGFLLQDELHAENVYLSKEIGSPRVYVLADMVGENQKTKEAGV